MLDGHLDGLENLLVPEYQTFEHDVLVIGAGGAGLRAAIEASAAGVSVGVVTKSLLGKAHTVMAEGGVAAAMGNVDDRDNWRVHFSDTMRGGQYLNNPRMAELHAKEAPDRVRELEAWGAMFDRTKDGRILQRNFGGHRYPRLAHVGDRTGLEMIRTLQDHGIHQGLDVHMECTIITLLKDGDRIAGAFGYDRERGRFKLFRAKAVVLATGGIGRAYKITSNSWEYTGDGHALAYHAGASLMDMEFVQFHPTGMVWPPSVRGILVTEGVRGEGGVLRNNQGKRFMFDDIPPLYKNQTADTPEEGWRLHAGRQECAPSAGAADPRSRGALHRARSSRRPRQSAWRRLPRYCVDQGKAAERARNTSRKSCRACITSSSSSATSISRKSRWRSGPTTHYMMGGVRVDGDTQMSDVPGLFRGGRMRRGLARRQSPGRQFAFGSVGIRQARRRVSRRNSRRRTARRRSNPDQVEEAAQWALAPFERDPREGPYQVQHELQDMMQDLVGIVRREEEMERALEGIFEAEGAGPAWSASAATANTIPGWHTALDLENLLTVSEAIARAALERKESRGAHFRDDYPAKTKTTGRFNIVIRKGPRW